MDPKTRSKQQKKAQDHSICIPETSVKGNILAQQQLLWTQKGMSTRQDQNKLEADGGKTAGITI